MTRSKSDIENQYKFCEILLQKLHKDMLESFKAYSSNDIYSELPNHSRMENDIVRIRRELLILSKMLKGRS